MLDYGYRSKCCYAPIRMGRKKIKKTGLTINIWICTKCKARDVNLVEYTGPEGSQSSNSKDYRSLFLQEDDLGNSGPKPES